MQITTFFWWDGPEGNVHHVEEHGLTREDFEHVVREAEPWEVEPSRRSGASLIKGRALDGRLIAVIYEDLGDGIVNPITAYELDVEE